MRSALPSAWAGPAGSCCEQAHSRRLTRSPHACWDVPETEAEPTSRSSHRGTATTQWTRRGTAPAAVRCGASERWRAVKRRLNLALLSDMSCNVRVTLPPTPGPQARAVPPDDSLQRAHITGTREVEPAAARIHARGPVGTSVTERYSESQFPIAAGICGSAGVSFPPHGDGEGRSGRKI